MSLEHRTLGLIEDDPIMGESLARSLTLEGAKVHWWASGGEALSSIPATGLDAVICDIRLPDRSGAEIFRELARGSSAPPFLFITGYGDIDQAVELMREGAHDYLTKPFVMSEFLARLEQVVGRQETPADPVLGVSSAMREFEQFLQRVARVGSNLLLTGETGVGKEVCARYLHAQRPESKGPFMAVNCAAIPADLIESELFGHEKGAFTGAHARHLGYAERAGRGVLFLDEIGELAPKLQAKLLRVIESRTFHRLGGERPVPFEARLICATNANLEERVAAGGFRDDLFYRINVLSREIPPLRNRRDDVEWLIDRFFAEFSQTIESDVVGVSALAYEAARQHDWPGNVRELRNRVERAVALAASRWIMPSDLFPERGIRATESHQPIAPLEHARDDAERRHIQRALAMTGGAILPAAKALGISRTTLWEKMKRLGLGGTDT
ncbi:sigma-54 dependent transcriptional regulator [Hyphomicrobium sp. CS1BSMeth3]|uniref:sigma-54-dependent transcriptional regulator n=1 Tax=Hyphomicrobium sp. CS1BSMeth3 TaxID=1892844 RepID=UPI0009316EBB|nr:sigma-54 dependent transcriptional regulator [Hyphomicrobium sp. CS1BSMeth3]MBN9265230.1 sigma-54-dependent Fis family transcriptional regulator [Hyphomicrobium sp.]